MDKAYNCYQKAALSGECPAAWYNIGDIYEKCSRNIWLIEKYGICDEVEKLEGEGSLEQKLLAKAIEYYTKSAQYCGTKVELNNGFLPAYYKLGNIYEGLKQYEKAFECYCKAAEGENPYPYAYNALGFFYNNGLVGQRQKDKAEEYYKIAMHKGVPEGKYNYAKIKEENDISLAIQLYRQLIQEGDENFMYYYALASCMEKRADMEKETLAKECLGEAIMNYQEALKLGYEIAEADIKRCSEKVFCEVV